MFECSVYGSGCNGTMLQTVFLIFYNIINYFYDAGRGAYFTKILVQLDAITR